MSASTVVLVPTLWTGEDSACCGRSKRDAFSDLRVGFTAASAKADDRRCCAHRWGRNGAKEHDDTRGSPNDAPGAGQSLAGEPIAESPSGMPARQLCISIGAQREHQDACRWCSSQSEARLAWVALPILRQIFFHGRSGGAWAGIQQQHNAALKEPAAKWNSPLLGEPLAQAAGKDKRWVATDCECACLLKLLDTSSSWSSTSRRPPLTPTLLPRPRSDF
jgi:hypothetical protein